MGRQTKWAYAVLILLILCALGTTFYRSLAWRYEMRGEISEWVLPDLEVFSLGVHNYDVRLKSGGAVRSFTVTGEDPQFIVTFDSTNVSSDMAGNIGGIELKFDGAWEGTEALPVQVFYARAGEDISERHSVKSALEAGEASLMIPIPVGRYETFRFDIDGDFKLAGIRSCGEPMLGQAYVSHGTVEACIWYFPAIS